MEQGHLVRRFGVCEIAPEEQEVEGEEPARTMPYLEEKSEGETSMALKQDDQKVCMVGLASPVRMVKSILIEPKPPAVQPVPHRSILEAVTLLYVRV